MSELYTQEDVIIWGNDPRLKKIKNGQLAIFGNTAYEVLEKANHCGGWREIHDITTSEKPFSYCIDEYTFEFPFMILKKESEKKRIPFDLSLEEDRQALLGRWVASDWNEARSIEGFYYNGETWSVVLSDEYLKESDELLSFYFFCKDDPEEGLPVGKEIPV